MLKERRKFFWGRWLFLLGAAAAWTVFFVFMVNFWPLLLLCWACFFLWIYCEIMNTRLRRVEFYMRSFEEE